ncbi:MAG: DinB family protein [Gemmatimonadetes bacterium]|nr:DinB family protein [Gemmatimonadota bacterium]
MSTGTTESTPSAQVIPANSLLEHWQGHRRLTRRVIEAFPEDQLFTFSVGGMRTFGEMAREMIGIAVPMIRGVLTDEWDATMERSQLPKDEILRRWDESTEELNTLWPQIPLERFGAHLTAFGMYPGRASDLILYAIDNEIHHRGQGYVYLRALGIEPPPFWERT